MEDLRAMAGRKLHLQLRGRPQTELKGIFVPLDAASEFGPPGGAIINLSFGISVFEAVKDLSLTDADFAATDLAVEMLYLVEAKSAAMEASRKLNLRLQGAKIAAEEQAFTDTLTGLRNRRGMNHIVTRLLEAGETFALMHLDLDYFKSVNDTLGHAAGDHVLQHVAKLMVKETRSDDIIVRTGGDEFVLIFVGLARRDRVCAIADRLIKRLEEPIYFNGEECRISASIGATLSCNYQEPSIDVLLGDADVALYEAKARGRSKQIFFDPTSLRGDRLINMQRQQ